MLGGPLKAPSTLPRALLGPLSRRELTRTSRLARRGSGRRALPSLSSRSASPITAPTVAASPTRSVIASRPGSGRKRVIDMNAPPPADDEPEVLPVPSPIIKERRASAPGAELAGPGPAATSLLLGPAAEVEGEVMRLSVFALAALTERVAAAEEPDGAGGRAGPVKAADDSPSSFSAMAAPPAGSGTGVDRPLPANAGPEPALIVRLAAAVSDGGAAEPALAVRLAAAPGGDGAAAAAAAVAASDVTLPPAEPSTDPGAPAAEPAAELDAIDCRLLRLIASDSRLLCDVRCTAGGKPAPGTGRGRGDGAGETEDAAAAAAAVAVAMLADPLAEAHELWVSSC